MNDNTSTTSPAASIKTKKSKGPIRWEAVGPFTLIVLVIWAYFYFFFDTHLRHAIQHFGTEANGAEVDVGSLRTSFWNASLEISHLQATDKIRPDHNKIEFGKIKWGMRWDALLRGKIVIDNASILEIAVGAPRRKPGFVLPPEPPPPAGPSKFAKLKEEALNNVQKEFSKNVLGDAASLLNGSDPKEHLKNLEGQLKSTAKIKELQAGLEVKQKAWQDRINKLPKTKDIQDLQAKLKAVKLDGFKSPAEVQTSLSQIDAIFKEADGKYKEIRATTDALTGDVNQYKDSLKELDALVHQDVKDLEARMKLPKLDAESLSQALFGNTFMEHVRQAEYYMDKARAMMPAKKSAAAREEEDKTPKPHEREKGRNYKFGRPHAYPLFWLRKAEISSKAIPGADYSGNIDGTLENVTDNPPILGLPTTLKFKGDFPDRKIMGLAGEVLIDHTTEVPIEKFTLRVEKFPLSGKRLVASSDVQFGFESAEGTSDFGAELRGSELKITTNSEFHEIHYTVDAKQPILAEILKGAVSDVPMVTLLASATGEWTSPHFTIDTNLARELAKAFEKQLQVKINQAKAQVQKLIDDQVGKQKAALDSQFTKAQAQIAGELTAKQDEINKEKGALEKAKNDAVNSQTKGLQDQGKKAIEDLKKQFHF